MKFRILTLIAVVEALNTQARAAPAGGEARRAGLWEQVDEKTGKAESWFNIVEKDGVYIGTIVKMFPKPGDPPPESWRCTKCEGADRNAQVLGLVLIKGMMRKGLSYENG